MSKLIDLTGKRFGKLMVIRRVVNSRSGLTRWLCRCVCECEKEIIVHGSNLKNGNTQSCGCFHAEKITKHGHAKDKKESKVYRVWDNMMQRCNNPNDKGYKNYGGRGITVCERWLKFENFHKDMIQEWKPKLTIERTNNEKGYSPDNCCWATQKQQQRNRRNNYLIKFDGREQCRIVWSEETGISYNAIRWRLNNGWTIVRALTQPVKKRL